MKILLVGSDPSFVQVGWQLLNAEGHTVTTATDGAEAWERFSVESFPIIISDWIMPELDGPALCRRIREFGSPHYTYLLLMTVSGSRDTQLEGLKAGADDFLMKPMNAEELATRLGIARRLLAVQAELEYRTILLEEHREVLAQTQMQLAQQGTTDVLTGLKNGHFFQEWLASTFALAARQGMSVSVILLTLHGSRDEETVKRCAQTLQGSIRQYDLISHCGQGEFGIILPATDVYTSQEVAARLQTRLRQQTWPQECLTTNFGVATVNLLTRTAPELHDEARKALHASLQQGPNRLVHASQVMPDGLNEDPFP